MAEPSKTPSATKPTTAPATKPAISSPPPVPTPPGRFFVRGVLVDAEGRPVKD